jgi:hypothetical protein
VAAVDGGLEGGAGTRHVTPPGKQRPEVEGFLKQHPEGRAVAGAASAWPLSMATW